MNGYTSKVGTEPDVVVIEQPGQDVGHILQTSSWRWQQISRSSTDGPVREREKKKKENKVSRDDSSPYFIVIIVSSPSRTWPLPATATSSSSSRLYSSVQYLLIPRPGSDGRGRKSLRFLRQLRVVDFAVSQDFDGVASVRLTNLSIPL